jgi:predicted outer membrane repeat protein
MGRSIGTGLTLICLLFSSAAADIWFIKPDGSGAAPTIQAAVDSASTGDTVLLANGTFSGEGNRDVVISGKSITVISISGNPETCVIDCEGSAAENHRGFTIEEAVTIEGITIENGYAPVGGAIYLLSLDFSADVTNCRFLGNYATEGGAICALMPLDGGPTRISDCLFQSNSAFRGGALHLYWHNSIDECQVTRCTFVENACDYGSVLYVREYAMDWGTARFTNCTMVGNEGNSVLWVDMEGCEVVLDRTIIAFNACVRNAYGGFWDYWCECTDIYGNDGGDWTGCLSDELGLRGNISEDPLFCGEESGDLTLDDMSPCAPAGSPTGCDLIGAHPVGCAHAGVGPHSGEPVTWGTIKAIYR